MGTASDVALSYSCMAVFGMAAEFGISVQIKMKLLLAFDLSAIGSGNCIFGGCTFKSGIAV